ncbi:MAG: threonylcarbamoyl-AMP synthase [Actinobacteria bacterium 21-73-9]|nr:MAG: threonylcarbamoyl-AMP synthase [Actinobacteria bacterium 21-73-9]
MRRLTRDEAADALAAGEVVAVPTDTVYGLAARLDRPEAIAAVFALKRRPGSVALPVLVAHPEDLGPLGVTLGPLGERLAERYWPGALTLVVSAPEQIAARVHARTGTLGVRVPADPTVRALLERTGPLAVTSANEHGEPPCTSAEDVLAVFAGRDGLAGVLDGGTREAAVSSVVEVTGPVAVVVREGALSAAAIADALG